MTCLITRAAGAAETGDGVDERCIQTFDKVKHPNSNDAGIGENTMATREDVAVLEDSSRSKSDGASSMDPLPPRWIAAALSGQGSPSSTNASTTSISTDNSSAGKSKWTGMRLVDTVVFDSAGKVESWIFTAKTGHVTSKKRAQDRTKIAERFERFALANPRNTERFVALLDSACPPGGANAKGRVVLDEKALREALLVGSSQQVPSELQGSSLQCYLRPQNGSNSFLRAYYQHRGTDPPGFSLSKVSPLYRLPSSEERLTVGDGVETPSSEEPILDSGPESTRLRSETERALSSLVEFLELRLVSGGNDQDQNQSILECKAEFVIDDNGELWLTSLPSVTVAPGPGGEVEAPAERAAPAASDEDNISREGKRGNGDSSSGGKAEPGSSAHMPPLLCGTANAPQTAAPLDGSGSTPLGSARRQPTSARSDGQSSSSPPTTADNSVRPQLGGELPAIPSTMLGARSSPGEHNSSSRGKHGQQGGTPIFEKKAGIYVANVHASALRGLCCWREVRLRGQEAPHEILRAAQQALGSILVLPSRGYRKTLRTFLLCKFKHQLAECKAWMRVKMYRYCPPPQNAILFVPNNPRNQAASGGEERKRLA